MTKIIRSIFYRSKQDDPLEEAEEPLAAAGEHRDLEVGDGEDETANSGGARRPEDALFIPAIVVSYFMSAIGIYYFLLGSFYLPPEAGAADGGRVIAIAGGAILGVAGPVLVGSIAVYCCCRSARRSAA